MTLVKGSQTDKYSWKVLEKLGGSDHKPILITREAEGLKHVNTAYSYKWDLENANVEAFRDEVEEKLPENYASKSVHKLEKILRKTITQAANKHIKMKATTRDSKPAISKEVKEKIEERNQLRKDFRKEGGKKAWLDKCKEVNTMIREEKEKKWKEYVEELDTKTNSKEVWKTIRNLDGRFGQRKENEVLIVDGKAYTEDSDKAKQFAKTYKKVSRIPKGERDRRMKQENRKFLNKKPKEKNKYEKEITMEDLIRVIEEAKKNKAAGEDTIPYEIIKMLGATGQKFILTIYNRVWNGEQLPQRWRFAVIKPLLKDGKDPELTSSYRPISLTDCLGKMLEKLIASRLMSLMEERNLINKEQAGFRKERCTTDQVTKLVQMASDQMQEKKTKKKKKRGGAGKRKSDINGNDQSKKKDDDEGVATIVTFFDFERAYDKVWREGLIHKMIKLGIPYSFIKYTRHFLSARRTAVEINNKRSPEFYLNEGLPQGSAISPLLFLIFINDITEYTKDGSTLSLFADDTAAWVFKGENKEEAERKMQENIDAISRWADDWKMTLNTDKTKVMVISSNSKDHKWKPSLFLKGEQLEVVKEYKFLGVIIDNQLRFNSHVAKTVAKCKRRNNLLRCLAGKDWGQSMESQKTLYVTYIRSALEYASPSWYPWISETARGKLEVVQNDSMRIMTRMAKKTPIDFL